MNTRKGFTFIEILVVIAIVAILAAIVALILNPSEYLRRARDAQRLGDASRINTAMALYSFGTASRPIAQDPDGPKYPILGSPPITDSCINDPVPHRLFVSVPIDNGEDSPTPPTNWVYSRVTSTDLRAINGKGWLPVDFTVAPSGQAPFSVLPVDPVNTFASGYYYSYGCGSWNMNIRFESDKFRTQYAATDQGNHDNLYEIGSDLAVLPAQLAYGPTSTNASIDGGPSVPPPPPVGSPTPTPSPFPLNPNLVVSSTTWSNAANVSVVTDPDPDNTTFVFTSTLGSFNISSVTNAVIYDLDDATGMPATFTVDSIKVIIVAQDTNSGVDYYLTPFLQTSATPFPGAPLKLANFFPATGTPDEVVFTSAEILGLGLWTKTDINNLKVGIVFSDRNTGTGALIRVSKIGVEVSYH